MRALLGVAGLAMAGCFDPPVIDDDCERPGVLCSLVGTGEATSSDEPSRPTPANETGLYAPNDIAVDPDTGTVYVVDFNNYLLRALRADGHVYTIAGNGQLEVIAEGPALETGMSHVADLVLDHEGGLYVAAWHNSLVMRLDLLEGSFTHVAGLGVRTRYSGDGGPAVHAAFDLPAAVAVMPDRRLLVTDQANQVIRQIDRETGIVDHFAGRCVVDLETTCTTPVQCPGTQKLACNAQDCDWPCTPGFNGDVVTADELRLALPYGAAAGPAGKLAVGSDGTVYIADTDNNRIRAIRPDRTVQTVAGGGTADNPNGLAFETRLDGPSDVTVTPDGTLYIADTDASCVRRVDVDRTIHTVAGICGQRGYTGNGLATLALLDRPWGIHFDVTTNRLYIADTYNHRVRVMTIP